MIVEAARMRHTTAIYLLGIEPALCA